MKLLLAILFVGLNTLSAHALIERSGDSLYVYSEDLKSANKVVINDRLSTFAITRIEPVGTGEVNLVQVQSNRGPLILSVAETGIAYYITPFSDFHVTASRRSQVHFQEYPNWLTVDSNGYFLDPIAASKEQAGPRKRKRN